MSVICSRKLYKVARTRFRADNILQLLFKIRRMHRSTSQMLHYLVKGVYANPTAGAVIVFNGDLRKKEAYQRTVAILRPRSVNVDSET